MDLGNFSVSLSVKDLQVSKGFYQRIGFAVWGGDEESGWLILKNGSTTIGLFQGMLESNMMTFNPGWGENAQKLDTFQDIREFQKHLKTSGLKLDIEADNTTSGPAHLLLTDPDGNRIMLDQHV
ncbi:MAG: VOC family protein [Pseudomonadota bacterium]